MSFLRTRLLTLLAGSLLAAGALAQLSTLGQTRLFSTGRGEIPTRAGYVEASGTISLTTQTTPIASGQSVVAVVTTDNFATTSEIPLNFDFNTGGATQWFAVLGPYAPGTTLRWYLRANGNGGQTLYDNNGGLNFGATWRRAPRERRGAILQWFATDYRTMMRRLPQVVEAGYGVLYLPPPQKSGAGGFSVGYNPFDRFDLGDRLQLGTVRTRYGTTQELIELIRLAHRYGLEVVCDLVPNHNDNRASTAINRYPDLIPEDFHIRSSTDTGNGEIDFNSAQPLSFEMLNRDLVGLADLAQEDGNATRTGPFNLPPFATFDAFGKPTFVRHPLTPQYYPGGVVAPDDVRGYLRRWVWYLTTQIGFDGFRLDAVKHVPPMFFGKAGGSAAGQAGPEVSAPELLAYLYSLNRDPIVFSEVLSSNSYELREFAKTGMNLLDFPLVNSLNSVFNANGFGDLSTFANGPGLDPGTSLGYAQGGLDRATGVSFIQSHDNGPPTSNNLATALTLTRPGASIVYYDGNNLDPNDYSQFPRPGRFEAIGDGSDATVRLVDARARFARGESVNRFVTSNLLVTERQVGGSGLLLTGLNVRGDIAQTVTVDTAFAAGTILEDLAGVQPNVTVGNDRRVTITVPANSAANNNNNARGYVLYAPLTAAPVGSANPVSASDESGPLVAETITAPAGSRGTPRNFEALVFAGTTLNLSVTTTSRGARAFVKLDAGTPSPTYNPLRNTPEGLTDGFVAMNGSGGAFSATLDLSGQSDGLHLVRVRVFNDNGSGPGLFRDFLRWIQVRREFGGTFRINGDLAEFGPNANVWQTRTPSSTANRLDGLFVSNDDQYLYIGLAGRVDAGENLTNGMALLLDTGGGGISDLSALRDDSGPAARLLSRSSLVLPSGFRPGYAVASFRGSSLGTSPEGALVGSVTAPPAVGAFAGAFRLNADSPTRLSPLLSAIAYQPRTSISSPLKGAEVAIPIRILFPNLAGPYASIRMLSWLGTTGEAGTTLLSTDPNRGTVGGRPLARPWVSNQFLPPQPGITGDVGTGPATLTDVLTYTLRRSSANFALRVTATPVTVTGPTSEGTITVTNTGTATISGPIRLMISSSPADPLRVLNRRGTSLFGSGQYLGVTESAIAAGASVTVPVRYSGGSYQAPQVSFTAYSGPGAL